MKLWILGLASALSVLSNPEARASLIDWAKVPGPLQTIRSGPDGSYTTGSDFVGVKVNVTGSDFAGVGLHRPFVYKGPFPADVLSTVVNFKAAGSGTPTVEFTIDFFGFKQGVRNVSFDLFNIDQDNQNFDPHNPAILRDTVTFRTAGLTLTGSRDNVVVGNTVMGLHDSDSGKADIPQGDVSVKSGNLPLHQIVFDYTQTPNGFSQLDEMAIGNLSFTPVPVPEVGQLAVGLVACLLGALWLHKNRRKRAHAVP